ncbi:MAG: tRNA (adenosine(37)-N6)-threonylcarbamoyltransferase complex transferase subunit TsaD [Candidatus Kerfeldbacteria bacterium]|nr:tRNA (adenosine(37)-N6)-threonylcarbamoyltransferase complex transferase subunit TsaD [Candidatus Kerfeldbacteria bacterium]
MTILAIETSCDETSAAVIKRDGAIARIRSNIVASQVKLHAKTGGVVPEVAAREHIKPIIPTIERALAKAKTTVHNVDALAVTLGPGLHTALSVGVETAKALSYTLGLPLMPINHLHGHIASNWNARAPKLPALCLIVSGGHTELVLIDRRRRIKLLGATRDDAAGEAFDKVAQLLRLGYPGGPIISQLAQRGNPRAFDLPRPMLEHKNFDFSFSGLKTAVRYLIEKSPLLPEEGTRRGRGEVGDLCASFQQAIVDVLVAKTVRAAKLHKPKEVLLAGGVAANTELRRRLAGEIHKLSWKPSYHQPPLALCTDNAGMIGLAAAYFKIPIKADAWKTVDIRPTVVV